MSDSERTPEEVLADMLDPDNAPPCKEIEIEYTDGTSETFKVPTQEELEEGREETRRLADELCKLFGKV